MIKGYHNVNNPTQAPLHNPQGAEVGLTDADKRRFWAKVDRGDSAQGCWLWTASRFGGKGGWYGQFAVGRHHRLYAHRVAWILTYGSIPAGQHVCHRCDVPRCCNPSHLFLGTHTDNVRDAASKGRLHVTRPKGHKVTTEQLKEIDALLKLGVLKSHIAARYGVSKTWMTLYAKGKRRQYDRPRRKERAA